MLNTVAIRRELAPKDGNFDFRLSDLEALFPEGMVDHNVDMVYKEVNLFLEPFKSFYLFFFHFLVFKLFCSDAKMGRDCGRLQRTVC